MSVRYRKSHNFGEPKSSSAKRESFHYFDCSEVTTIAMRRKTSDEQSPNLSKRATVDFSLVSNDWHPVSRTMSIDDILSPTRLSLDESIKNHSLPDFIETESNLPKTLGNRMAVCGPLPFRKQSAEKKVSKSVQSSSNKKPPLSRKSTGDSTSRDLHRSSSTNYMSKVKDSGLSLENLLKDDVFDSTRSHHPGLSRSRSEYETRSACRKEAVNAIVRNVFKSRSLKAKEEPLLRQVVRKVIPFKNRSISDNQEEGGSLFHRRQVEVGGSAPTSPQTTNKLPKIPNLFRKNSNTQKDKPKDEGSEDITTERSRCGVLNSPLRTPPNCSPIYATPTRSVPNMSQESSIPFKKVDDEALRRSNTLKLWIQEAKDIPDKRGYYCQLLLNGKKYDQTTTKMKNGLCFWGEHFVLANIPEKSIVTIRLIKKDKDKEKLVGYADFAPKPTVQEPRLDRWINLTTEKNYRDKESPTLRCRHFLQQVTILPLAEYKGFVNYLKESSLALCRRLESHLNVRAKEDVVKLLISVLQHYKKAVSFLGQLIIFDVEETGNPDETMFRGNSMATKAIEAYMKLISTYYLSQTLYKPIATVINTNKILEVDPNRLNSSDPIDEYRSNLQNSIEDIWQNILRSAKDFPVELQQVFYAVRERIKRPELSDNLISACVFLRLLCPAVLSPSLFNLTKEYPEADANRKLTLVAKTLQTLANFTTYQSKEPCMQFLNNFILREQENCRHFLRTISGPIGHRNNLPEFKDQIDVGLNLSLLHIHLKHAMDTINCEALDSELRRLKRQLDFLSDCLARHEKNSKQSLKENFTQISDTASASTVFRRDFPTNHTENDSRLTPRRQFSNHLHSKQMYERSTSCKPEIASRYEFTSTNRAPASDLSTSDNYVLQSAFTQNSGPDAHNITNNNIMPDRGVYRTNNTDRSSADTTDLNLQTSFSSPNATTPRHRTVTKSVSTLIRYSNGTGDTQTDDFDWQQINNIRDTENNMRTSSPNIYPVSPKASSGYHSLIYSPSSSPIDQVLLTPLNANVAQYCSGRSNSRLSGYESAQGSPMQRKAQSVSWNCHEDSIRFSPNPGIKFNRTELPCDLPSSGSPVYAEIGQGERSSNYSPETPCQYETCHQLPIRRISSSSSSSSSSPSTPTRQTYSARRTHSNRRHGNNLINKALSKAAGIAPRTNPHFSPRLSLTKAHTNSPLHRKASAVDDNEKYHAYQNPSGEGLILYDYDDAWPISYSQDDHMQAILERLLTMEQEIRDEQETLLQEMNAKDRLLAKQKRHIAALDNANSQLIRQIASLTASVPASGRDKISTSDQTTTENNEDVSLDSLSPSDVSDNKSSSPC